MRKKIVKLLMPVLFIFTTLIFFTGCDSLNIEVSTPDTSTMLKGQWKVEQILTFQDDYEKNSDYEYDDEVGEIFSFGDKEVVIFNAIYKNVTYKAKLVNSSDYIYNALGYLPDQFDEDEEFTVVTISAGNTFIKDIITINEDIFILDGQKLLRLDKVEDNPMENPSQSIGGREVDEYGELKSGVLIGLKSYKDDSWNYRTIWVKCDGDKISVKEIPYILLPKKNGFFMVDNEKYSDGKKEYSHIYLSYLSGEQSDTNEGERINYATESDINEDLTFIGNDYMSIRSVENAIPNQIQNLGTYLIDLNSTETRVVVPISSLTGNSSIITAQDFSHKYINRKAVKNGENFTNYAIGRNRGRWCFYTLTDKNYNDNEKQESTFNDIGNKQEIMTKVSREIAKHDELFTSWQGIKNQVPSATDAFSSPNENLALIKTRDNLYAYKIKGDTVDMSSQISIELSPREEVIMAEWALGQYVDYWSDFITRRLGN